MTEDQLQGKVCPSCGVACLRYAQKCDCGHEFWPSSNNITPSPTKSSPSSTRKKLKQFCYVALWVAAGALPIVAIVAWRVHQFYSPAEQSTPISSVPGKNADGTLDKSLLVMLAQKYVKMNLKAPSTADFPGSFDEYIFDQLSDNEFMVTGYVEAKNPMGVPLRVPFAVSMRHNKDNTWQMTAIKFKE